MLPTRTATGNQRSDFIYFQFRFLIIEFLKKKLFIVVVKRQRSILLIIEIIVALL